MDKFKARSLKKEQVWIFCIWKYKEREEENKERLYKGKWWKYIDELGYNF